MTKRRLLAVLCGAAILAALAVSSGASDEAPIASAVVEQGTFEDHLPVRGEIRPARSVVLTAPSAGGDLQIVGLARNGQTVATGDIVVEFDATSQQRTREQHQSELKQAESERERVRAEGRQRVAAAKAELERLRSLEARARLDLGKAELSSEVDAKKLELELADAGLRVRAQEQHVTAEQDLAAAELTMADQKRGKAASDVAETERAIASLTLRAPTDGVVSLRPNLRGGGPFNRSPPEFKRGDRAWFGAPIAELPDLHDVYMSCRIDEADRARVRPGAHARVRVDALPDRDLEGRVDDISLVAKPDFSSWPPVRNFDVVITLDGTDPRLRSGMSASARLELERLDDVLIVPRAAVFSRDGTTVAYVLGDGEPETRPITVGRLGLDQAVITSGLRAGERVALQDPAQGGQQ